MKAYMGSTGTRPVILNFGTRWWGVINITPQLFYPWETTTVPTE